MHNGIDLGANYENVYAVLDGIVSEAGWDNNGGGNYIKVKHSNRFETSYLHRNKRIDTITPKYALIGTHAGRRTFICNALSLGIPPQVVMK